MRIGIILSSLGLMPGGLETIAAHLARGLADRNHDVLLVRGNWPGRRSSYASLIDSLPSVKISCVPADTAFSRATARMRDGWPLKLQSLSFAYACRLQPAAWARIMDCEITVTFLEVETVKFSRWRARHGKPNLSYFPGCIDWGCLRRDRSVLRVAGSNMIAERHERLIECPIHGVVVPGVGESWLDGAYDVRPVAFRLVFVGRFEPNKGIAELLDIVEHLNPEVPNLELRLVGDGPLRRWVEAESVARGLSGRVLCVGPVSPDRVRQELRRADLFVFPSHYESFGIAVLEALAVGVPVVSSDLPALREVAADAAVMLPVGDIPRWVSAVQALLQSQDERRRLSAAGRARARGFSWARSVYDMEEYLNQAVTKRPV